jgi:hypothetical protein
LFIHIAIISIMFTIWTIPFLVYPYRHYIHHVYNMNYAISCLSISSYMHINTVKLPVLISTLILSACTDGFYFLSRNNMPNGYSNIGYFLMNPLQQYYLCHYKLFFYDRIDTCQEEVEDTKGVIRIRISKKNRQHNDQKKKYKWTI